VNYFSVYNKLIFKIVSEAENDGAKQKKQKKELQFIRNAREVRYLF
jgi:hypothetical protein